MKIVDIKVRTKKLGGECVGVEDNVLTRYNDDVIGYSVEYVGEARKAEYAIVHLHVAGEKLDRALATARAENIERVGKVKDAPKIEPISEVKK